MTWDRELAVLEEAIRRLSAEYDAFLYGTAPRPPVEGRRHVEQMVQRLNASSSDSSADRYRFTTLQVRYNALCERWERLQAEKESGRRPGLYGHFATGSHGPSAGVPAPSEAKALLNEKPASSVTGREASASDRNLFDRYVAAKKARGENVSGYRYEDFAQGLDQERRKLKGRLGDTELEFDVVERDGRVKLVARRRGVKGDQ